MPFSIGGFELVAIVVAAAIAALLRRGTVPRVRWAIGTAACTTLAALFTPADLFSMAALSLSFLGVFVLGFWKGRGVATAFPRDRCG